MSIPLFALAIRQPWAWLIIHGGKDVENRTWRTGFRGRFLIHASLGMKDSEYLAACDFCRARGLTLPPPQDELRKGGVIGSVEIVDCVTNLESSWFEGPFGFVMRNPVALPFHRLKGSLAFFRHGITELKDGGKA